MPRFMSLYDGARVDVRSIVVEERTVGGNVQTEARIIGGEIEDGRLDEFLLSCTGSEVFKYDGQAIKSGVPRHDVNEGFGP